MRIARRPAAGTRLPVAGARLPGAMRMAWLGGSFGPALVICSGLGLLWTAQPASGSEISLRSPASYRTWKLEAGGRSATISQLHVPLTGTISLGRRADLVVSSAAGFSTVKPDSGRTRSLNGMTDASAQLFLRLADNRVLLQAGVNLPTGRHQLRTDELDVAQGLAHPLLAFRLKQYGQGFDLSAGAAVALPIAPGATLGFGAGRVERGTYALVDGSEDYDPAPETALSLGLDLTTRDGAGPSLRLDAVRRLYGTDRQGGVDLISEGDQTELQATAAVGSRGPRGEMTARFVLKSDNRFHNGPADGEPLSSRPGSYGRLLAAVSQPLGTRVRLGLNGEWSSFSGSDAPGLDGFAYGAGPTLGLGLGRQGAWSVSGSYLGGRLDASAGSPKTDLTGFSIASALVWRFGS